MQWSVFYPITILITLHFYPITILITLHFYPITILITLHLSKHSTHFLHWLQTWWGGKKKVYTHLPCPVLFSFHPWTSLSPLLTNALPLSLLWCHCCEILRTLQQENVPQGKKIKRVKIQNKNKNVLSVFLNLSEYRNETVKLHSLSRSHRDQGQGWILFIHSSIDYFYILFYIVMINSIYSRYFVSEYLIGGYQMTCCSSSYQWAWLG